MNKLICVPTFSFKHGNPITLLPSCLALETIISIETGARNESLIEILFLIHIILLSLSLSAKLSILISIHFGENKSDFTTSPLTTCVHVISNWSMQLFPESFP